MLNILMFRRHGNERVDNSLLAVLNGLKDKYGFSVRSADPQVSTPKEASELLAFWRPDACIVNNDKLPADVFADYPSVFQHRTIEQGNPRHATITFDEKVIAETAARHLLSLNLASYAYVPPRQNEQWNQTREGHFVHMLSLNGFGVASYRHPQCRLSTPKRLERLAAWIANLPRPVGVFAANDAIAVSVIAACDHIHLEIPWDVTLLGVDNMENICEDANPTLSSIAPDTVAMREESFRLISQIISGRPPECRCLTVKPLGVVRRASTLRKGRHDPAVVAACDMIRRHACEGLKARDVAATFPCGRRMAEIRFRAALGHSILDEILSVRRAKAQMATSPIRTHLRDEIASLCGYSSWSSVYRLLESRGPKPSFPQ